MGVPALLGEAARSFHLVTREPERRRAGCPWSSHILPGSTLCLGIGPTRFTQWGLCLLLLSPEPGQGDGWVPASPGTLLGPCEPHPHPYPRALVGRHPGHASAGSCF